MASHGDDTALEEEPELPPPYAQSARPPPGYSELQESRVGVGSRPTRSRTFEAIEETIASAKHSHEIRQDSDGGFAILKSGRTLSLYQITRHTGPEISSMIMWKGTRDDNLIVAQAKVPRFGQRTFEICLHPAVPTSEVHWIAVQCKDGGILRSESYSFSTAERPLTWKRTHSTSLGSSRFSGHDFKLLDESRVGRPRTKSGSADRVIVGGDVMAVFTQHGTNGATASRHRQLDWLDDFGEHVEVAALITLMAILELSKNHVRSSGSVRARAKTLSLRSRAGSIRSGHNEQNTDT